MQHNPDERERRLERDWLAGDPEAGVALLAMLRRRGARSYDLEDLRLVTTLRESVGYLTDSPKDKQFSRIRGQLRRHGVAAPLRKGQGDVFELRRHSLEQVEDWLGHEGGGINIEQWGSRPRPAFRVWWREDWGDYPHQAVFVSPAVQAIVTFTEGDVTVALANSVRDYIDLYREAEEFYAEGP